MKMTVFEETGLTERETEVLQLVADGYNNGEIVGRLFMAPTTLKNHFAAIYRKLGVEGRTQAVLKALRLGVVTLHDEVANEQEAQH